MITYAIAFGHRLMAAPFLRSSLHKLLRGRLSRIAGLPTVAVACALALMVAVTPAVLKQQAVLAQESAEPAPQSYSLSTATTGGAFHQGGVSLSALVKIELLPNRQIDLTTVNSSGSLQNIARLRDGNADFAIVQGLLGDYARSGTGIAASLGAQTELRSVMMLWPNVEHFIIRKNLATTGTITDFLALRGKRVSLGRERSAIESNRVLLGNLGMNIDEDVEQALLSFRPSVAAFRRGEIDGLSLPASTPVPAFIDLMEQLGPDAVTLRWTEEQLRQADGGLGIWSHLTLPTNTYAYQPEPITTIAQPNFLAVRADVDDDVVYAITKAVFENLPFLKRLHAPFQFLTPERAVAGLPVPLHPGALRYYEEIGLDIGATVAVQNDYNLFGEDLTSAAAIRQRVGQGIVNLMTTEDSTSDLMVDDLLDVMSTDGRIRLLPIRGKGAAHNLADLIYLSGIDIGVLQADALDHERDRGVYRDLAGTIRYIAKWADAEVHLLVRDDILNMKDLRDQVVNFGPEGSGSEVTASWLFNQAGLAVKQTSDSHSRALKKLKAKEIAGMVYVAPKPAPLLHDVEVLDGLRFLSLPEIEAVERYRSADLTVEDYPSLIFGKQTVKTLAVPLVLATYNWPTEHERYAPIASFVESFLSSLDQLQDPSRHSKWQDVDLAFNFDGWQRHQAVNAYLQQLLAVDDSNTITGRGGPLATTLENRIIPEGPIAPAPTSPARDGNQATERGEETDTLPVKPAVTSPRRPIF